MQRLLIAVLGGTLSVLLLGLPAAHVAGWSGEALPPLVLALSALPLGCLLLATLRPAAWTTLFLFPVSHLPALAAEPRFTGRLVYSGASGLGALALVILCGAAFVFVALGARLGPRGRLRHHGLAWSALGASSALLLAFWLPVFTRRGLDPAAAQVSLVAGLAVAGWVGSRWVVGEIGDLLYDPRTRERLVGRVLAERRVSPVVLWTGLSIAAILGAAVLALYRA